MKNTIRVVFYLLLIFLFLVTGSNVLAQNPVCNYCGIPMSAATRNSNHKPSCRYYSPPTTTTPTAKSSSVSSPASPTNSPSQSSELMMLQGVMGVIDALFDANAANEQKKLQEQRIAAELKAQQEAEEKRLKEEAENAKFDKTMKLYKPISNTKLKVKPIDEPITYAPELLEGSDEALREQNKFEKDTETWIDFQKKLFSERLEYSNKWCSNLSSTLTSNEPILPPKRFDELQPGDVLLIKPRTFDPSRIIVGVDNILSLSPESSASHTVTYLKEVNGQKLFMDCQPLHGPIIISEKQLNETYGNRSMDVAHLATWGVAQPLNNSEAENLFKAAVKMQYDNLNSGMTNYGAWGKNDVVCSEASWALIQASGRKISGTDYGVKSFLGVDFSPADFYAMKQYFLVTPLNMQK